MSGEQLALLAIGALLGLFEEVRIVDVIKNRLGLVGWQAKLAAAATAVGTSLVALFAAGEVGIADFNIANFPVVFSMVYGIAELLYYHRKNGS